MNVAYLGFSPEMVSYLTESQYFKLIICYCEKKYVSDTIKSVCIKANIPLVLIDSEREIEATSKCYQIDFFIVYKTSIIIHNSLLDKYAFYNFHGGCLKKNRGANPLVWTILLGFDKAELSLHKIEAGIDCGLLISKADTPVYPEDTTADLEKRLSDKIPVLLKDLNSFFSGELRATPIYDGIYRRRIKESDYTIDFFNDNDEIIIRKIQSQKTYNGAILAPNNLYVHDVRIFDGIISHKPSISEYLLCKNDKTYIFSL